MKPAGMNPAGTNPAGTNPAGTNPAGTNPVGVNPAGVELGYGNRTGEQQRGEHMDRKEIEESARKGGVTVEEIEAYLAAAEEGEQRRREALRGFIGRVQTGVLELGAGAGAFTREILEDLPVEAKLYALERLEESAEKIRTSIEDPRLTVLTSDATAIPLPDGAVDLVVSRVALHDFVSADGNVLAALGDSVRVLAPGGTFLIEDKTVDGFDEFERESAEGRMERVNSELAALEGKICWGLHRRADYEDLLRRLGLGPAVHLALPQPDVPGYKRFLAADLEERRAFYIRKWGPGVEEILSRLFADLETVPARALPRILIWAEKPKA